MHPEQHFIYKMLQTFPAPWKKGKGEEKKKREKKMVSSMEPLALDTALVFPGSK